MREDGNSTLEGEQVPVLLNGCHGDFCLSDKAWIEYKKRRQESNPSQLSNDEAEYTNEYDLNRFDPILIKLFNEWGSDEMGGPCSSLYVDYIRRDVYDSGCYEIDASRGRGFEFIKIYEEIFEKHTQKNKEILESLNLVRLVRRVLFSKEHNNQDKIDLLQMAFFEDANLSEDPNLSKIIMNLSCLPLGEYYEAAKSEYCERANLSTVRYSLFGDTTTSTNNSDDVRAQNYSDLSSHQ